MVLIFRWTKQSLFIIKDIDQDRVNLKISTAISKIVYQSSMVKTCMSIGISKKKQKKKTSRLETMTKWVLICAFFDVVY